MVVFHLVILLSSLKHLFAQHRLRGNKLHFRRQCRFNGLILNLFQTWGNREANLPFNGENVNSKCIRLLIYPFTNLIHRRECRGGAWAWLKFTSHFSHFPRISFSSLFKFIFALNFKLFPLSLLLKSTNLHLDSRLIHFRHFSSAPTLRQLFRMISFTFHSGTFLDNYQFFAA